MYKQEMKTHLYDFHAKNGKVASFAGFSMPIWFKGIKPEHLAVRNCVGIFDVTHMGRVLITGIDAEGFLNYVTTNNVAKLEPLDAHYSTMCNRKGGIKDDFVLSRQGEDRFFMVYNAANRNKNYRWLKKQARHFEVSVQDVSENTAMFAVQGPKAQETLQKLTPHSLKRVGRFKCSWTKLAGSEAFISRTGYTGEDGFEVFVSNTSVSNPGEAVKVWTAILAAGREFSIEPCGLGARDTLRLEAGMCLYGNDINEITTPLEARISFVVKFDKEGFVGKEALLLQKTKGVKKRRVGLRMVDSGIPRPEHKVLKDGKEVGRVTSGTFSPLLKCGIAMAYIKTGQAVQEGNLDVEIRGRHARAELVKLPFYDATQYGYARKQLETAVQPQGK